jgi:hypothetical protein
MVSGAGQVTAILRADAAGRKFVAAGSVRGGCGRQIGVASGALIASRIGVAGRALIASRIGVTGR